MKIKYYYKAKSQQELDQLIGYLMGLGFESSSANYDNDYNNNNCHIGITHLDSKIYCTSIPESEIQGELTTDIEVFKSQFKTTNMKSLKEVQAVVGENFAVKWENSPEFKSYIEWINGNGREMIGLSSSRFYGVEYGDFVCKFLENYTDNTKVLTAKEIMAIINERTIEDIGREIEALLKEKEELEAAQPLELWLDKESDAVSIDDYKVAFISRNNRHFARKRYSLIIDKTMFDIKLHDEDDKLFVTFHKKVKQCN